MTDRQLVSFLVDERSFALPLPAVDRVLRAVEVTPLAGAPVTVLGIVDVAGQVTPVLSLRRLLGLPERALCPEDQFLVVHTSRRTVALLVDAVNGLLEVPDSEIVPPNRIFPELAHIRGVVQRETGLIVIQDLERFLSIEDERVLDEAMRREASHAS